MNTYYHVTQKAYTSGDALKCFDLLEEAMVLDTKCKKLKKTTG